VEALPTVAREEQRQAVWGQSSTRAVQVAANKAAMVGSAAAAQQDLRVRAARAPRTARLRAERVVAETVVAQGATLLLQIMVVAVVEPPQIMFGQCLQAYPLYL
jgi:hypothetical protein